MDARWVRFAVAITLTVTITAETAGLANAAEPIVVGSCATSLHGAPGTPVELSPSAVVAPIVNVIDTIPLLGPPLAQPFGAAFTGQPPIPIGALPTGTGTISGAQIATAVVDRLNNLPLLDPILGTLVGGVQSTLTSSCGIAVTGLNSVVVPVQDGTAALDQGSHEVQQSIGLSPTPAARSPRVPASSDSPVVDALAGSIGEPSLFGDGSTLVDFSGIALASAGLFARLPGSAPGFGVVSEEGAVPPDSVQTAGGAEALGLRALTDGIGLPILLAVLMLAGVTAALVRTCVVRRTNDGPSA